MQAHGSPEPETLIVFGGTLASVPFAIDHLGALKIHPPEVAFRFTWNIKSIERARIINKTDLIDSGKS